MFRTIGLVLRWGALGALVLVAIYLAQLMYSSHVVSRWDAKIDALCAANGGKEVETRVYETVMAPETKEYFRGSESTKMLFVPSRSEGATLGPQYPYVMETRVVEVLNEKDPSVLKYVQRVVRVSDNKVLGERVGYQRGGGMPGPDPVEIRNCPDISLDRSLAVQVFLNHPSR